MAKKRKVPPKSDPAAASAAAAAEQQQQQEEEERQQQQQQQQQQQDLQKQQEEEQIQEEDPDLEEEDLVLEGETQVLDDEEDQEDEEEEEEDPENTENVPDSTQNNKSDAVTDSNPNGSNGTGGEDNEDNDDGEEPVQKLLEPFTKDQLIDLLREASEKHSDVLDHIRKLSDTDPVHRKIFVHGLGWDTNSEILTDTFKKYGEIEDCNAVCDKITGKSKGYAFILFKHRSGARRALKEPQKKIGSRMTACQLASAGPVPNQPHAQAPTQSSSSVSEYTQRKIYVSNVAADIDPQKLVTFFSKFGEIEEGPLGLDKQTGKPKGFALFVYKSIESARKALEEPHKTFEGHVLHCQKAIDGPKPNKPYFNQYQQHSQGGGGGSGGRPSKFARTDNSSFSGNHSGGTGHLMAQSGPGLPYQGGGQALNPVLGQALTALLASQGGGGLGLGNLLGTLGSSGVGPTVNPTGPSMMPSGMQGGYGNQHVGSGYGGQPGMQGGYGHSQMGQGSAGRSQKGGHMGGVNPYLGH